MSRFNKAKKPVRGGRKRGVKNDKEFKVVCRNKVAQGLINQGDGSWKPIRTSKSEDMYLKGYHL